MASAVTLDLGGGKKLGLDLEYHEVAGQKRVYVRGTPEGLSAPAPYTHLQYRDLTPYGLKKLGICGLGRVPGGWVMNNLMSFVSVQGWISSEKTGGDSRRFQPIDIGDPEGDLVMVELVQHSPGEASVYHGGYAAVPGEPNPQLISRHEVFRFVVSAGLVTHYHGYGDSRFMKVLPDGRCSATFAP